MPKSVITVRCEPELHERLKQLRTRDRVSLNKWCIDALEYAIRDGFFTSANDCTGATQVAAPT